MAYITFSQYTSLFGQPSISEDDFNIYATLASDLIDSITRYSIEKAGGISMLPATIQLLVEKAAGAQVLYFSELGMETVLTGQSGLGFTVGKVHVDGSGQTLNKSQTMISPMAQIYLEQSGLMGRRVTCLGPFPSGYFGIW